MAAIKITAQELEERKLRIIHCAFHLFRTKGIEKVSVKDIAAAAKVGEKSVYRYFVSKTELLQRTVVELWREIVSELTADIDETYSSLSGYEQIRRLLDGFRNLHEKHADYVLFSYECKQYLIRHSAMMSVDEYSAILLPLRSLYTAALEKGMRDGTIAVQMGSEALYFAIWGLMRGYVVKVVIYDYMYAGVNVWRREFELARSFILSGLKNGLAI